MIEATPTATAAALGGPHAAVRRSTPPYKTFPTAMQAVAM